MKFLDFDGPFMTLLRKLWAIVGVGVLFLLLCLPFFSAGLAFTALYTVADRNLKDNRGYVFSGFITAVKTNWKQSLPTGAVIAAVLFIFEWDIRILTAYAKHGNPIGNMYVLMRVFQVLVLIYSVWVFAQIAVFENTLKQVLKNALVLMVRHLGSSLLLLLLLAFGAAVIWVVPISAVFMPVVVTWLMTAVLGKVFSGYSS